MIPPTQVSHKKLFQSPHVSLFLALLVLTTAFTQLIDCLLNQPAAYWQNPLAATPNLPFKFLFQSGAWLYLALVVLYLVCLATLLRTLNASAGFYLACSAFCFHWIVLYWDSSPTLYPLIELSTWTARQIFRLSVFIIFLTAFILILMLRPKGKINRWLRAAGSTVMLGWVLLLSAAVVKIAYPSPSVWTPVSSAHSPGPRTLAAVAYDTKRQRAVFFGGISSLNFTTNIYETSTWEWDGQDWHEFNTKIAPSGRYNHGMAYDPIHDKVYLYGGKDQNGTQLLDLWEWDGAAWQLLCPVCNPAGRSQHSMFYDPDREKVIIYGGLGEKPYPEAWMWDGTAWSWFYFATSKPAFNRDMLVYDPTAKQVVCFMGADWGGTWTWSGDAWAKLDLTLQPPLRYYMYYGFDPVTNDIYLFGGYHDGKDFNDTWIFDGQAWEQLLPALSPPVRTSGVAFYDEVRKSFVIYGGDKFGKPYNDMWELKLSEGKEP
jgi:hypothetical protein